MKRLLALLLAMVMVVSMVPVSAIAEGPEDVEEVTVAETEPVILTEAETTAETEPETAASAQTEEAAPEEPAEAAPAETEPEETEAAEDVGETEPGAEDEEPVETVPEETEGTEPDETIPEETEEAAEPEETEETSEPEEFPEEEEPEDLEPVEKGLPAELAGKQIRASGDCGAKGSEVKWYLTTEGELYVAGEGAICDQAPGGIMPWDAYIDGDVNAIYVLPGIYHIGEGAFRNPNELVTVELPDTLMTIGEWAFADCRSLESITIPDSVMTIGAHAFDRDPSLKNITLGKNVFYIGEQAFRNTLIESLTFPRVGTIIAADAFEGCKNMKAVYAVSMEQWLTLNFENAGSHPFGYSEASERHLYFSGETTANLVFPDSVTKISQYAFVNCTDFTTVTISANQKVIDVGAFKGCTNVKKLYLDNLAQWLSVELEDADSHPLSSSKVEDRCFYFDHRPITELIIPGTYEYIPQNMFVNCTNLISVTIPESVKYFGRDAFKDCASIEYMHIKSVNSWLDVEFENAGSHPFCDSKVAETKLYADKQLVTKIEIQAPYSKLNSYVFKNCKGITAVDLPTTMEFIQDYAFDGCSNLKIIRLWRFKAVTFSEKAFAGISADVCYPRHSHLYDTGFKYGGDITWKQGTFGWHYENHWRLDEEGTLGIFGIGSMYNHGNTTPPSAYSWHDLRNDVKKLLFEDTVTSLTPGFTELTNMTCVNMGSGVYNIEADAFRGAVMVSELHVNSLSNWLNINFMSFESNPLYSTTKPVDLYVNGELVTNAEIPEGVHRIPSHAFRNCAGLTSVTIPASMNNIGYQAFTGCDSLHVIFFQGDLPSTMNEEAFAGIEGVVFYPKGNYTYYNAGNYGGNIRWVELGDDTDVLAQGSCGSHVTWSLTPSGKLTISGSGDMEIYPVGKTPWYTYRNIIHTVEVQSGVTTVSNNAFSEYPILQTVILADTVKHIHHYAFSGCPKIERINLPMDLRTIGKYAFADCTGLFKLELPESLETICDYAFQGCTDLTSIKFLGGDLHFVQNAFPDISATASCYLDKGWNTEVILSMGDKLTWMCNPREYEDFTLSPDPLFLNFHQNVTPQDITVKFTYADGTVSTVRLDLMDNYDFKAPNTSILGEGVMTLGISAVWKDFPIYVLNFSHAPVNEGIPESEHPYPAGSYQEYTVKHEGAAGLRLIFSNDTDLGDGTLIVLDNKNNEVAFFTDTDAANQIVDVSGDTAILQLQGGSGPIFGFRLASVIAEWHNHIFKDEVVPLTCTQDGRTIRTCIYCGHVQIDDFVPAPGHTYEKWETDEKTHWRTCTVCNETDGPEAHKPDRETAISTEVNACSVCGYRYPVISVTGPEALRGGASGTYKAAFLTDAAWAKGGVTWQLRPCDTAFASISKSGKLKTKAVGQPVEIVITATAKKSPAFYAEYTVKLHPAAQSVTLLCEGEDVTDGVIARKFTEGQVIQLSAQVASENALQTGTWKSSSAKTATVTADGQVTFKKRGTAKFTFTATGGVKKKATVTIVCGTPAEGLSIEGAAELISGQKTTLTAKFTNDPTVNTVTWTSSDPTAATVNSKGKVTAKTVYEEKTVTITATAKDGSGQTAEHTITVSPKANVLGIRREGKIVNGQTLAVNLSVKSVVLTAPEGTIWKSSRESIAKVEDGVVTFEENATGKVVIIATSADGKQSGKVTLNHKALLTWIKIEFDQEYAPIVLPAKGKTTLRAINRANRTPLKAVTWSSSNPKVATVSSTGVVTARPGVTKETYVYITATAKDGGGESCSVSVKVLPQTTVLNIYSGDDYVTEDGIELKLFEVLDGRTLTFKVGSTVSLRARAYPDEKDAVAPQTKTWKSSSTKIATVNSYGDVTSLKAGTVTISAKSVDGKTTKVKLKFV